MTLQNDLEILYERYSRDPAFQDLRDSGSTLVKGYGLDENPPVLFVGEAPGVMEDISGKPFVGRSGVKFEEFLKGIGYTREEVFTTNVLKYHPPQNRDPLPLEVEVSGPYLIEEINLVNPMVVACIGRFSMQALLPDQVSITKANGKTYMSPYFDIPVIPIIHPGAMLRPGGGAQYTLIRVGFGKLRELINATRTAPGRDN